MIKLISLYLMAGLYMAAGINHFVNPKLYLRIIPRILPNPKMINILSGLAEIILAIGLLIPATRIYSAWGIIILLILIFPANIYHLTSAKLGVGLPIWILWLRLPMQGLLIWWAWIYTW
ncbi:MAG: putative membrane protein [Sphingobacteriales bacterium]|jgi:uncharacterized membrane protein